MQKCVVIKTIDINKIRDFVHEHKSTKFDQNVDYPSPIYSVTWKGRYYSSGLVGDEETIVRKIYADELLGIEWWSPEKSSEMCTGCGFS